MQFKTKFDVILNMWVSIILNVILSIALPLLAIGMLTFGIFLKGFIIAFAVSTAFVFFVPVVKWGGAFAAACKAKPNTPGFIFLSCIVLALVVGTLMSLLMTAVNAGIGPWFVQAWLSCYPFVLLIVYVSALIGLFTGIPLTKKILGIPSGPPAK